MTSTADVLSAFLTSRRARRGPVAPGARWTALPAAVRAHAMTVGPMASRGVASDLRGRRSLTVLTRRLAGERRARRAQFARERPSGRRRARPAPFPGLRDQVPLRSQPSPATSGRRRAQRRGTTATAASDRAAARRSSATSRCGATWRAGPPSAQLEGDAQPVRKPDRFRPSRELADRQADSPRLGPGGDDRHVDDDAERHDARRGAGQAAQRPPCLDRRSNEEARREIADLGVVRRGG